MIYDNIARIKNINFSTTPALLGLHVQSARVSHEQRCDNVRKPCPSVLDDDERQINIRDSVIHTHFIKSVKSNKNLPNFHIKNTIKIGFGKEPSGNFITPQ